MLLEVFSFLTAAYLIFRGILYLLNIRFALKFVTSQRVYASRDKIAVDYPFVVILIPLLREQRVFKSMIEHFSKTNYPKDRLKIVLVTTEKEIAEQKEGEPSTIDLANDLRIEGFLHLHYPQKTGVMAHQLNFAVRRLSKVLPNLPDEREVYVAVYNADSAPNKQTLEILARESLKVKYKEGILPPVFQQISAYARNFKSYSNSLSDWVLKASAIVQTRWGLGAEIPMLHKQAQFMEKKRNSPFSFWEKVFEPPAYCVGHGLFVRLDVLKEVGLFPTETFAEDLPLGYYLVLSNYPIRPLPILENVESPASLSTLLTQKATWFWGMIDYFSYFRNAPAKVKDLDRTRSLILALKGLRRDALAWLLASPGLFLLMISPFLAQRFLLIPVLLAFFFYVFLPSFYLTLRLPRIFAFSSGEKIKVAFIDALLVGIFSLPYLLVSSMGPWKTLGEKILMSVSKYQPRKRKTER